jgi:uncharacterized protein
MSKRLHISDDLSLSLDAVTQTFAVLAKRGVGKTYTASVMAEEMLKAGQQVVALDPTGAWWGLRSGFPIVIIGGEHGDIPLEESAGEVIAQAIVDNRFSAVIDLSLFRKGQMIRFMVAFAETLYRLNREALHLFVDEADAVAPQAKNYGGDENRMLGAMEDIVRRGRKRGIGCTLITQRPAVLNKNVLTQCEVMVAMRLVHPKDIDAIEEWVNVHADPVQAKAMIDSLPSLPVGAAWFWSPGWGDIFQRVKVRTRETFDSSATPKPGETEKKPKVLAAVDINALGQQIKSTVKKAKENDPKALRAEVARLRAELTKRPTEQVEKQVEKIVEKPVVTPAMVKAVQTIVASLEKEGRHRLDVAEALRLSGEKLDATAREFVAALRQAEAPQLARVGRPVTAPRPVIARPAPRHRETGTADDGELTGPERKILNAIAWLDSVGVSEPEQTAVAFLAGYTFGGGGFNNPRGALRTKGLVNYLAGERIALTDDGRKFAEFPDEVLTTDELHRKVLSVLPGPEQRILKPLLDAYPNAMSNEDLSAAAGYTNGSGGYNNPRGRLRSLGLVEYRDGGVAARSILFLDDAAVKR